MRRAVGADGPARDIVERFYAAIDGDDAETILALCAEDVVVRYPAAGRLPYGGEWSGHDALGAFLDAHEAAEEILEFAPTSILVDGETVVVLGAFRGRARATDRIWATDFVHVLTISDGRICRWVSSFDTAAALDAR